MVKIIAPILFVFIFTWECQAQNWAVVNKYWKPGFSADLNFTTKLLHRLSPARSSAFPSLASRTLVNDLLINHANLPCQRPPKKLWK